MEILITAVYEKVKLSSLNNYILSLLGLLLLLRVLVGDGGRVKLRALYMLDKCSTHEQHPGLADLISEMVLFQNDLRRVYLFFFFKSNVYFTGT